MERVFTVEEAAERFHVSHETIRRWLKAGRLQATRPGRRWLITESAMEAVLRSGKADPA
jgi:excisionase family DNA binding protein